MSIEITIKSTVESADVKLVMNVPEEGATVTPADVVEKLRGLDIFNDNDDLELAMTCVTVEKNGVRELTRIPDGVFKENIINSVQLQDGDAVEFSLEFSDSYKEKEDDPADDEQAVQEEAPTPEKGTKGQVTVSVELKGLGAIGIINGVTTIHDVVFGDIVKVRTGMTAGVLSICLVRLNDDEVPQESWMDTVLNDGDDLFIGKSYKAHKDGK